MKKMLISIFSLFIFNQHLSAQNATFEVNYTGFTPEAEAAFEYAAGLWSDLLISDVPIKIEIHLQLLLPGQLGITFPNGEINFPGTPLHDVWYASCLANAIAGEDLSPDEADIEIYLNSLATWYYGLDGIVPPGKYDFVSTVLHEICHGLGFLSLANKEGSAGSFGLIGAEAFAPLTTSFPWPELDTLPSIYDVYLENLSGMSLITFDNPSDALGTAFTSNLVYFNSPMILEDNGGERARMYAPGSFVLGSSVSHWDEGFYPIGNPNELMTPQAGAATSNHSPGPLTLSLLDEIGWEIIYDTATIDIHDLIENDFKVFPNPASNELIVSAKNTRGEGFGTIYNLLGEVVKQFELTDSNSVINIDDLIPGNYLIKLNNETTSLQTVFIKM